MYKCDSVWINKLVRTEICTNVKLANPLKKCAWNSEIKVTAICRDVPIVWHGYACCQLLEVRVNTSAVDLSLQRDDDHFNR